MFHRGIAALLPQELASGEGSPLLGSKMSGELEELHGRDAQLERQALKLHLTVFLMLLEPLMILVMGGVVLVIVPAVLLQ
jgi:type II secretory pathway component PulF